MPTRLQIRLHPPILRRAPPHRLHLDLHRALPPAQLLPRARHRALAPLVPQRPVLRDGPRPQQRLAPALDHEVREHEQHAHVPVAGLGLPERVARGSGELVVPHERQLVEEGPGDAFRDVQDVWAAPRAEALAWRSTGGQRKGGECSTWASALSRMLVWRMLRHSPGSSADPGVGAIEIPRSNLRTRPYAGGKSAWTVSRKNGDTHLMYRSSSQSAGLT